MGGCISTQPGIERKDLFYNKMLHFFEETKTEVQFTISLGNYQSFDTLNKKNSDFINKKDLDIVFLFIRPFPLMPLQKPFIKYDSANGSSKTAIHPSLLSRKLRWDRILTLHQSTSPYCEEIKRKKIALRDLNIGIGIVLGLHTWANRFILSKIIETKNLFKQKKIKLFVISPPKNPESMMANKICKWTTDYLKRQCLKQHISYLDINKLSMECFKNDGIHFNQMGHYELGKILYKELKKFIEQGSCITSS